MLEKVTAKLHQEQGEELPIWERLFYLKYSEMSFHSTDVTDYKEIRRATVAKTDCRWVEISV